MPTTVEGASATADQIRRATTETASTIPAASQTPQAGVSPTRLGYTIRYRSSQRPINTTPATSYLVNITTNRAMANPHDLNNGILGLTPNWTRGTRAYRMTMAEVPDGLSKTAMISEGLLGTGHWSSGLRDSRRATYWKATAAPPRTPAGPQAVRAMALACQRASKKSASDMRWGGTDAWNSRRGFAWGSWDVYWDKMYDHMDTPNEDWCSENTDLAWGSHPPQSNHGGGVNVLMGDGAVVFVSDNIDWMVWLAQGTRNGGESTATGR